MKCFLILEPENEATFLLGECEAVKAHRSSRLSQRTPHGASPEQGHQVIERLQRELPISCCEPDSVFRVAEELTGASMCHILPTQVLCLFGPEFSVLTCKTGAADEICMTTTPANASKNSSLLLTNQIHDIFAMAACAE